MFSSTKRKEENLVIKQAETPNSWFSLRHRIRSIKYFYTKIKKASEPRSAFKKYRDDDEVDETQKDILINTLTMQENKLFSSLEQMLDLTYDEFLQLKDGQIVYDNHGRPILNSKVAYGAIEKINMEIGIFLAGLTTNEKVAEKVKENIPYLLKNILELQRFFHQFKADHALAVEIAQRRLLTADVNNKRALQQAVEPKITPDQKEDLKKRWLSFSDADIQEVHKKFIVLKEILGTEKSKTLDSDFDRTLAIFDFLKIHRNISLRELILKDTDNKIKYDGRAAVTKSVDGVAIAQAVSGLESFIDNLKERKCIKRNFEKVLPILLDIRTFMLDVKMQYDHARNEAERLLISEDPACYTTPKSSPTPSVAPTSSARSSMSSFDQLSEFESDAVFMSESSQTTALKPPASSREAEQKTQIENLQKQIEEMRKDHEAKTQKLQAENLVQAKAVTDLQKQLRDKEAENKKNVEVLEADIQKLAKTQQGVAEQLRTTESKLAAMEEQRTKTAAELAKAQQLSQQTADKLKAAELKIAATEAQRSQFLDELAVAAKNMQELKNVIATTEAQRKVVADQLVAAGQTIQQLQGKIATAEGHNQNLVQQNTAVEAQLVAKNQEVVALQKTNAQLTEDCQNLWRVAQTKFEMPPLPNTSKWRFGLGLGLVVLGVVGAGLGVLATLTGVGILGGIPLLAGSVGIIAGGAAMGGFSIMGLGGLAAMISAKRADAAEVRRYHAQVNDLQNAINPVPPRMVRSVSRDNLLPEPGRQVVYPNNGLAANSLLAAKPKGSLDDSRVAPKGPAIV